MEGNLDYVGGTHGGGGIGWCRVDEYGWGGVVFVGAMLGELQLVVW